MFLFVQARIASQRRRARCPFLAIYIKYRFFSTFGKISTSHEHPCTNLPLLLPPLLPPPLEWIFVLRLLPVKPAPLDLTNGTTKERNRYFHGSTRFRACIPRSTHPPLPNRLCPAFESALSQSRPSFCSIYLKLGFLPYPSTLFSTLLSFPRSFPPSMYFRSIRNGPPNERGG